jgi:hypothetical protein
MLRRADWDYATETLANGTRRCITASPTVTGNLLWTLHLWWLSYERSGDQSYLRALLPVLERAVAFHVHLTVEAGNSVNLTVTFSPEYAKGININYDLALFRCVDPGSVRPSLPPGACPTSAVCFWGTGGGWRACCRRGRFSG